LCGSLGLMLGFSRVCDFACASFSLVRHQSLRCSFSFDFSSVFFCVVLWESCLGFLVFVIFLFVFVLAASRALALPFFC
jgi:hypothetical protein